MTLAPAMAPDQSWSGGGGVRARELTELTEKSEPGTLKT